MKFHENLSILIPNICLESVNLCLESGNMKKKNPIKILNSWNLIIIWLEGVTKQLLGECTYNLGMENDNT